MNWNVHFSSPARLHLAPTDRFSKLGVEIHHIKSANSHDVDIILKLLNPDVVIFDRFITEEMISWRVREHCPHAALVLDSQDLHFLRLARQHLVEEIDVINDVNSIPQLGSRRYYLDAVEQWNHRYPTNLILSSNSNMDICSLMAPSFDTLNSSTRSKPKQQYDLHPNTLVKQSKWINIIEISKRYQAIRSVLSRELASFHRSDLVLLVSSHEKKLLVQKFQMLPSKLALAPFFYDLSQHQDENATSSSWSQKKFHHRKDFCMIGHFKHPPNRDSILWLKREIWPIIRRRLPGVSVNIYGANPDRQDMMLTDPSQGLKVQGPLKEHDLQRKLASHRLNLAPLRFGAGIKGKITDSWLVGLPNITTSIGSESMMLYGSNDQNNYPHSSKTDFGGAIGDSAEHFSNHAIQLYTNESLWYKAQHIGWETLQKNFTKRVNDPLLQFQLDNLVNQIDDIRDQNIIGNILWQSGLKYNEMFGRYVQLKDEIRESIQLEQDTENHSALLSNRSLSPLPSLNTDKSDLIRSLKRQDPSLSQSHIHLGSMGMTNHQRGNGFNTDLIVTSRDKFTVHGTHNTFPILNENPFEDRFDKETIEPTQQHGKIGSHSNLSNLNNLQRSDANSSDKILQFDDQSANKRIRTLRSLSEESHYDCLHDESTVKVIDLYDVSNDLTVLKKSIGNILDLKSS